MVVELELKIPPGFMQVNLTPISLCGREIGFINHISRQIDDDLFVCHIDVFKDKEEFVLKIIEE